MRPGDVSRGFYVAFGATFGVTAAVGWVIVLIKVARALWRVIA
ncbi:hypothetical protein GGQ89_003916 [Sphingomonas yabuuchiae]|uniref:Seryl-tRNA synthetase n=1 Tax=Sphingomonas yabuuchiae TaxID=172044 RepID=A0ABR6KGR8_9SPHN|nr:hypothetical protein [Sphingomonas yabuuchiae]